MGKVLAALLVLAIPLRAGDPEVAEFLLEKGKKEARAKNYEEAEQLLRRSIAEITPNPEASFEHGQVLEKLDRAQDALAAYSACIAGVEGAESPPAKWKGVARRAERALSKLRKQFAALDAINRQYLPKFLAFGKLHYKTHPRWARQAFETVLAIDPTNASAKAYLAKLPGEAEAAKGDAAGAAKGRRWGEALIDKGTLKNWEPGEDEHWSIDGEVIQCEARDRSGYINWLNSPTFHGKYALQYRFRVTRDGGDRRTFGVFIGNGKTSWWAIMIDRSSNLVLVRMEEDANTEVSARPLDEKFKLSAWHTMRIEVDNDRDVEVFLDDKAMLDFEVPKRQKFEGQMAFFTQAATVEFKALELRK